MHCPEQQAKPWGSATSRAKEHRFPPRCAVLASQGTAHSAAERLPRKDSAHEGRLLGLQVRGAREGQSWGSDGGRD